MNWGDKRLWLLISIALVVGVGALVLQWPWKQQAVPPQMTTQIEQASLPVPSAPAPSQEPAPFKFDPQHNLTNRVTVVEKEVRLRKDDGGLYVFFFPSEDFPQARGLLSIKAGVVSGKVRPYTSASPRALEGLAKEDRHIEFGTLEPLEGESRLVVQGRISESGNLEGTYTLGGKSGKIFGTTYSREEAIHEYEGRYQVNFLQNNQAWVSQVFTVDHSVITETLVLQPLNEKLKVKGVIGLHGDFILGVESDEGTQLVAKAKINQGALTGSYYILGSERLQGTLTGRKVN